jgi:MFS family permease
MVMGTRVGSRLVTGAGPRPVIVAGFAVLALGSAIGATTSRTTGYGITALWITLVGTGLGFVLPSAMNAAMGTLPPQRAGSGAALMSALRQAGGTIGVAVLGTILNSGYHAGLGALNTPPVNESVSRGVAAAQRLGQPSTLRHIESAFVHGMDLMLAATAGICAVAALAALVIFPRRNPQKAGAPEATTTEELPVGAD